MKKEIDADDAGEFSRAWRYGAFLTALVKSPAIPDRSASLPLFLLGRSWASVAHVPGRHSRGLGFDYLGWHGRKSAHIHPQLLPGGVDAAQRAKLKFFATAV